MWHDEPNPQNNKFNLIFLVLIFGGAILESIQYIPPIIGLVLILVGVFLFLYRRIDRRRHRRYIKYHAAIGGRLFVEIAEIAAIANRPPQKVRRDLTRMIEKHYFTDTSFIEATQTYFLRDSRSYNLLKLELEKQAAQPKESETPEHLEDFKNMLLEFRQTRTNITDPEVSAQAAQIEQITTQIFDSVSFNPDKMPQIRRFLSYYLPTTLKLLRTYGTLEQKGIQSENAAQTQTKIKEMMSRLTTGFSSKLDRLYKVDFLDIASDVQVLEQIMTKDGLLTENNKPTP